MSQEKYSTVNAEPPEPLSNRQPKAIYPSYPIFTNNMSLNKELDHEFTSAGITTRRTVGLGRLPVKNKSYQNKYVSQTSSTTETYAEAFQTIEVEHKCIGRRKKRENASVWRDNAFITYKKDNKDESSRIISEEILKRRVVDLEHQFQRFKSKAYYKASNDQISIDTCQEKVEIL